MKVTIKEVAKRAGVSPATVSRVVGRYGYVSEPTRRKVASAIQALGYRPDAIARSMVTRSTRTVGLVVTDITNPFFAQLARGVEAVCWQDGYTLILANTDENPAREQAVLAALQEKRVDGLIVVPASSAPTPHLVEAARQGPPLVLADRNVRDCAVDSVLVDNEHGAWQAVSHLVRLGYRRIGMVLDNPDISTNVERLAGYRRALQEAGWPVDEALIRSCQYTQQSAQAIVAEMLARTDPPRALFTANNFMTVGAIRAVAEAGLSIPGDLALVGFDDLEWNELSSPRLTAVAQPVHDMGRIAAQRLVARMRGDETPPQEIRLKTTFIVRESCGAARRRVPALASR